MMKSHTLPRLSRGAPPSGVVDVDGVVDDDHVAEFLHELEVDSMRGRNRLRQRIALFLPDSETFGIFEQEVAASDVAVGTVYSPSL